jgi:hypothetical protein
MGYMNILVEGSGSARSHGQILMCYIGRPQLRVDPDEVAAAINASEAKEHPSTASIDLPEWLQAQASGIGRNLRCVQWHWQ